MIYSKKAFTLVELVAVITLLGVIAMIAVPSYNNYIAKVRKKDCEADKRTIEDLIRTDITKKINDNEEIDYTGIKQNISDFDDILREKMGEKKYDKYKNKFIKIKPNSDTGVTEYEFIFASEFKENGTIDKEFCE